MNPKIAYFQERITANKEKVGKLKSKSKEISIFRIVSFLAFIVLFIVFLNMKVFTPIVILTLVFSTGFGLMIRRHNHIKSSLILHQKIGEINQEEIDRLNYDFSSIHQWEEFSDEKHPYSGDLDLYGKKSVFQLVNRAETKAGINLMKSWLENYVEKSTIETRQSTIRELMPLIDWRQKIQAHGRTKKADQSTNENLNEWLAGQDQISNKLLYKIIPYIMIAISGCLLIAALYQILPFFTLFPALFVNGFLLMKIWDYSKSTYELTSSGIKLLQSIEQILILIEKQNFNHKYLTDLKSKLFNGKSGAANKILELRKIFDLLNLRGNQVYHIFNLLFLTDFIFLIKAERWRKKYKNEVAVWFETIAEFESLNSLAAFAYAHENYVFPIINEETLLLSCKNLGHPLIPPYQRINNDFEIQGDGQIGIITGSNMSGKSTFLRTIGVNTILAFAGAPVCADELTLSVFQVFTSMRTKDNLDENISSFYAELLRLKQLLENINEERPVLFLLDEILKGTNSTDRHIGAEALAIQLSKLNAFGLISTHDLKLGELQLESNKLKNYNFSSSINGQEIIFDYKLRDGICQSTNASQLMAKIGIQIDLST